MQLVAHLAHRLGQPVVGVLQAGPHRVAADVGDLEHVEDRPEGRGVEEGHVGVPPVGPVLLAVDGQHLGVALDVLDHRVALGDHPELPGEVGLLLGGELLVPEEDHVVAVEGGPHGRHRLLAQRPGEVDPGDLGPDQRGERADVELRGGHHGTSVPQCRDRRSTELAAVSLPLRPPKLGAAGGARDPGAAEPAPSGAGEWSAGDRGHGHDRHRRGGGRDAGPADHRAAQAQLLAVVPVDDLADGHAATRTRSTWPTPPASRPGGTAAGGG